MLYTTPTLTERDIAVIAAIESYRQRLRHALSQPRRWKGQLRRNLRARAMRGSNSIEGYDVSLDDAIALLEGEETLDADQRTVMEITGYRNAMTYVQQLASDDHFHFDQSLVRSLHFMMLGHDLSKSPGSYRKTDIYVKDEDLDEVVYEGPDAENVGLFMEALLVDLENADDNSDDVPVIVTAAMAHLNLVMIHPFRDGNGRMARCLQAMILARNQILTPEFSSIEEWLGRNTTAYYNVFSEVGQGVWSPQNDASPWIRFNLRAQHMQAQTVLQRVEEAEQLWNRLAEMVASHGLSERTIAGLYNAALGLRVRRTAYESDAGVEANTASRDLRALVNAGLLISKGETRGRYYVGSSDTTDAYRVIRQNRTKLVEPYEVQLELVGPSVRRRVATVTAE